MCQKCQIRIDSFKIQNFWINLKVAKIYVPCEIAWGDEVVSEAACMCAQAYQA